MPHRLAARGKVQLRTVYVSPHVRAAACQPVGVIEVSALVRELIVHLVERRTLQASSPADQRLTEVLLDQLRAIDVAPLDLPNPGDELGAQVAARLRASPGSSLDALAAEIGASRRTIERRFQAQTGMSWGRWRRRAQVLRAIELLAAGASVNDTSDQVGYSSPSAFVNAFRRQLGTTPGRYFSPSERAITSPSPRHAPPVESRW